MKRKKLISVGIALFILVVSLSSWFLVKHEELKATQSPKMSGRTVYNIPEPAKINTINLGDNYSFLEDAGQVTQNIVNQNNVPNTPPGTYVWNNVVQMVEQNELGQGLVGQKGALWYNDQISIEKGFKGEFETYLGNQNKAVFDGISFTLQNDPDGLQAIGTTGYGFGISGSNLFPDLYIKNAISIVIDAGDNSIYAVVPKAGSFSKNVRSLIRYNYHKLNISDFGWLANGVWQHLSYEWDAQEELFSYTVTFKNAAGKEEPFEDSINFKTGATSSNWVDTNSANEMYPPEHPGPKNIEEIVSKPGANNYFGGESLYWGFTGTSYGSSSQETHGSQAIAPLVSVELTPNQSQSPLVLSMTKLGELNSSNERQPLGGATFILQAKNQEGKWQQFDPEPSKNIPKTFKTGSDGKITIQATNSQDEANLIDLVLQYGGTDNYQAFRFREVEAATGYIQPPAIDPTNPNDYAASESEHSAGLFASKSVELSGASTTPSNPTPENPGDGDFGEVYNNTPPTIELTKSGVGDDQLSGVEMTIGARVTDKENNKKVVSLAQLANEVKETTTYQDTPLTTNASGKITVPADQISLMMDLASSSLDVYESLDQWVFIETKAVDTYKPSPFSVSNGTFSAQNVSDTYKNKFIFDITNNWSSGNDVSSAYTVPASNALNQFKITPEAVGPNKETLSEVEFKINDAAIATSYPLAIGNDETAPLYNLTQTKTKEGYDLTSPIGFKLIQDAAVLNKFMVILDTENASRADVEFYYLDKNKKKVVISPNTQFTSSDFLDDPNLYVQVKNSGNIVLGNIEPLNFGNHNLPFSGMNAIYRDDKTTPWSIPYTDNRSEAEKNNDFLYLYAQLESDFTYYEKDENDEDAAVDSIANILRFKDNPGDTGTAVKEITTTAPELIKTFKTATPTPLSWTGEEGFFLDVKNAYYEGKISPSNVNKDYKAVLLLTIAKDAIPPTEPPTNQ